MKPKGAAVRLQENHAEESDIMHSSKRRLQATKRSSTKGTGAQLPGARASDEQPPLRGLPRAHRSARRAFASVCILALLTLAVFPAALAAYQGPIPQAIDAFGRTGPYSFRTSTFPNPRLPSQNVTVLLPEGTEGKRPVWCFSHGYGGSDPDNYRELLRHLASHGSVVVYPSYPALLGGQPATVYSILHDGFVAAAQRHAEAIDTTRVGFAGHSYGGGATPWLALKAFREDGWGSNGIALLILAPWYSFLLSDADLAAFSQAKTAAVVQVYEDDTVNDLRMGIDLFTRLGTAAANKDYLMVRSDRVEGYNYQATHRVPTREGSPDNRSEYDALDSRALHRIAQALCEAVWKDNPEARAVALGDGSALQTALGATPSGRALRPMAWSDAPVAAYPSSKYAFAWDDDANPRRASPLPSDRRGPRLGGLSIRAQTGAGADTLIAGMTITGAAPKSVLLRAVGPGLQRLGVTNAAADPSLQLYDGPLPDIDIDDWESAPAPESIAASAVALGAFPLAPGSKDAALLVSLKPGATTMQASLRAGTQGVTLLEAYDAEEAGESVLCNLSARAGVGTGEAVLIAGFIVSGGDVELLLRGVGPGLVRHGVAGALSDPELLVYQGDRLIASNDNWSEAPLETARLEAAATRVSAFALERGSRDAALLLRLPPGAYTAHLRGRAGNAGNGLIEVYAVSSAPTIGGTTAR